MGLFVILVLIGMVVLYVRHSRRRAKEREREMIYRTLAEAMSAAGGAAANSPAKYERKVRPLGLILVGLFIFLFVGSISGLFEQEQQQSPPSVPAGDATSPTLPSVPSTAEQERQKKEDEAKAAAEQERQKKEDEAKAAEEKRVANAIASGKKRLASAVAAVRQSTWETVEINRADVDRDRADIVMDIVYRNQPDSNMTVDNDLRSLIRAVLRELKNAGIVTSPDYMITILVESYRKVAGEMGKPLMEEYRWAGYDSMCPSGDFASRENRLTRICA
jgi:hypothetical protein